MSQAPLYLNLDGDLVATLLSELPAVLRHNTSSPGLNTLLNLLQSATPEPSVRNSTPENSIHNSPVQAWLADSGAGEKAPIDDFFDWSIGPELQEENVGPPPKRQKKGQGSQGQPGQKARKKRKKCSSGGPAHPKKIDVRNANKSRAREAGKSRMDPSRDVFDSGSEDEVDESEGEHVEITTSKQRAAKGGWVTTGSPPMLDKDNRTLLVALCNCDMMFKSEKISILVEALTRNEVNGNLDAGRHGEPLSETLKRYKALTEQTCVLQFHTMITAIQISLYIDSKMAVGRSMQFLATEAGYSLSWLEKVRTQGLKCARWATGGTMYILLIIAALGMTKMLTVDTTAKEVCAMASEMRRPTDAKLKSMLSTSLVPKIRSLAAEGGLTQSFSFFTRQGWIYLDFSDFQSLDRNFDAMVTNTFVLSKQDAEVWGELFNPPTEMSPPPPLLGMPGVDILPSIFHIKTSLKLKQPRPYPSKKEARHAYTEKERERAMKATRTRDATDLEEKLKDFYVDGIKGEGEYLYFQTSTLNGSTLKIDDPEGNVVIWIATHLKAALAPQLAALDEKIQFLYKHEDFSADSMSEDFEFFSDIYNFCYNRYAERGDGVPLDSHPDFIAREGTSHVNHGQRIPHPCQGVLKRGPAFYAVAESLADVAHAAAEILKRLQPEKYEHLKMYTQLLPLFELSPLAPFGGFVLNIASCTVAHRDGLDAAGICLLFFSGDWIGGEVVFVEPGLVIQVQPWDVLGFPSADVTHLNLHFKGRRVSVVFHSDRDGTGWVTDRNGWLPYVKTYD